MGGKFSASSATTIKKNLSGPAAVPAPPKPAKQNAIQKLQQNLRRGGQAGKTYEMP